MPALLAGVLQRVLDVVKPVGCPGVDELRGDPRRPFPAPVQAVHQGLCEGVDVAERLEAGEIGADSGDGYADIGVGDLVRVERRDGLEAADLAGADQPVCTNKEENYLAAQLCSPPSSVSSRITKGVFFSSTILAD